MTKLSLLAFAVCVAACSGGSTGNSDAGTDAGTQDGGSDAGSACTTDSQCTSGFYCAGNGCGTVGDCETIPVTCPPAISKVCGCDGNSYDNSCQAFVGGTRVFATGDCPTAQCTGLFNQIQGAVDAGQACSVNTDCQIDRTPCGIGPCWAAVDKSTDSTISPLESQYSTDACGSAVVCACTFLPSGAECDGGFCVPK